MKGKNKVSTMLIGLCWLVYTCSYIGKVNYAANINQVIDFYKVDHSSAGLVSTCFFFAYGIGQIFNGLFCKKYNLKWMVCISLILSGIANLVVGISNHFSLIKYVWLLNGFSMSILWPSLILLLSECLPKKDMTQATLAMGTTVATGTFLAYGLSALLVKINFKLVFNLAAAIFAVVAILWVSMYSGMVGKIRGNFIEEEIAVSQTQNSENKQGFNKSILLLSVVVLGVFGVATNLVKDGLTTWVPSILKEQYHLDSSFSIILTLLLPVVSIFGNAFAVKVHKKIPDYVMQCAAVFLVVGVIMGGVIGCVSLAQFWLTLIAFASVCFLSSSCNTLITNIFPLFMKGKVNSGLMAGILNGCCYLGSTLASYGLGAIADNFGWITVFWTLFFVCVGICVVTLIYVIIKKSLIGKSLNIE